jgi:hypothetical protein
VSGDIIQQLNLIGEMVRLHRRVGIEAQGLAERVVRGDLTREQVQAALDETGDGEPALALQFLDALTGFNA